jgi:hypothetical protein
MSDVDSRTIQKIQKLFDLANGTPYQDEAEAALMKAQELLCANNLTQEDVDAEMAGIQSEEVVDMEIDKREKNIKFYQRRLLSIIAENFRCLAYLRRLKHAKETKIFIVGKKEDAKACKAAMEFIFHVFNEQWNRYQREIRGTRRDTSRYMTERIKMDYLDGFASGLEAKFSENITCKDLIVVIDDTVIEDYESRGIRRRTYSYNGGTGDGRAIDRGYRDGHSATERNRIGSPA